jgi:hypothetical protein
MLYPAELWAQISTAAIMLRPPADGSLKSLGGAGEMHSPAQDSKETGCLKLAQQIGVFSGREPVSRSLVEKPPPPKRWRGFNSGRGERIRTSDPLLPKQAR